MFKYILIGCYFVCVVLAKSNKPFKACHFDDTKCQLQESKKTLEAFLSGFKPYGIPLITPLVLPLVEIQGSGLTLSFEKLQVHGMEKSEFKDIKVDTQKKTIYVETYIDEGAFIGPYKLTGKIGPLVLDGQDMANITAIGTLFKWTATYDVFDKKGVEYAKIVKTDITFHCKKVYFNFENLVKGNPLLSKTTNDALNDDWEIVVDDIRPGVDAVLSSVFQLGLGNIMKHVPLKDIIDF